MEIRMHVEATPARQGSPAVPVPVPVPVPTSTDAIELSDLLREAERAVDAHSMFLRDTTYPARFTVLGDSAWRVTLRARRLGTTGMKRRYREVDGEGPTPELAIANLVEGLDYLAEEWK